MNRKPQQLLNHTASPQRRKFLEILSNTGVLVGLGMSSFSISGVASKSIASENGRELVIGAQGAKEDSFSIAWAESKEPDINLIASTFRGHAVAQHPLYPASALMFARRPGYVGIEVDLISNQITQEFKAAKERHFFGHGCFNKNASALFTTEADLRTAKGKIGIRDAITYEQIGEYESHGIGPHQLALMPDGQTLVVANGGIHTHPDSGRKKLNLDSMESSLSYIDINNGKLLDEFRVEDTKSSIRHLHVASDGTVAFAMQFQREAVTHNKVIPLAGIHAPNQSIQLLKTPENLIQTMNDYIGSVAISQKHKVAGFTSPRGNIVAFWDTEKHILKGYHSLVDVCGIALNADESYFTISNSFGQLRQIDTATLKEEKSKRINDADIRWDNHLYIANIIS